MSGRLLGRVFSLSLDHVVETIIQGISSMIPIPTPGAIGSIETPDDKVRELALKVCIPFLADSLVSYIQVCEVWRDSKDY